MSIVADALGAALHIHPRQGSWISFNCVACTHNGETPDKRKRGSILLDGPKVIYRCFNCHFVAIWAEGQSLSKRMKDLMSWAGISEQEITRLNFQAWAINRAANNPPPVLQPDGLQSVQDWIDQDCLDTRLLEIAEFLLAVGDNLNGRHWTPDDNDMDLSRYVVKLYGQPVTRWSAFPVLDDSLPQIMNRQPVPEPSEVIPPEYQAMIDAREKELEEEEK